MNISYTHEIPMGHRLQHHAGRCRHLHGHNYLVTVSVSDDINDKTGMVMDFHDLKATVRSVLDVFDHAFVLQTDDPACAVIEPYAVLIRTLEPPTAENLAVRWQEAIMRSFERTLGRKIVVDVLVHETRDCAVEA